MVSKLQKGLPSKDFVDRDWNCNLTAKVNGVCAYKGECHKCWVVYKVTCRFCGDFCVENIQNTLKNNGATLPICALKVNAGW